MDPELLFELFIGFVSLIFTLLIFSYVLGDNPLFRAAVYVFVGVSAGYIAAVALWQVIIPLLISPLFSTTISPVEKAWRLLFPMLGSVLILMKISPRLAGAARVVMAFIVGVGAAVIVTGALSGTLVPQVLGAINAFDMNAAAARNINQVKAFADASIVLAGTVLTLIYFHFGARPKPDGSMRRFILIDVLAWGGRIFIGVTLGAVFAGVYTAALTALIERIGSIITFITGLIGNFQ